MKIQPSDAGETYLQRTLVNTTVTEIERILGFPANVKDDPDKVEFSWGFTADGKQCGIWDWKGSHHSGTFSAFGPREVFVTLFGSARVRA